MSDQRSPEALEYRKWYKTARWRSLRIAQLTARPLCRYCQDQGHVTPATICDHAEPHRGDPVKFWSGPFISLCKPHHDSSKQSEERLGRSQAAIGVDGWPV
jgi:hypothetical protein